MNYLYFLIILILFSCNNEKKTISITFVETAPFDEALNKYPIYYNELSTPFVNCELDFLLKPISIKRLDISNKNIEINAWWFEAIGDNTVEFSKNWLNQFFKDSTVNDYLKGDSKRQFNLNKWINKNKLNLYIYSDDFEGEEYEGIKVFTHTKELHNQIVIDACSNSKGKIQILINPKISNSTDIKQPTNPTTILNCVSNDIANKLKENLLKIVDTNLSKKERQQHSDITLSMYFDKENGYVKQKKFRGDKNPSIFNPGEVDMYLYSLTVRQSVIDFCIENIEISKANNKISGLVITEINNGSVVEN